MKKKIYFLAPKGKGGTYFYYKEISEYLIKNYSDIYDVYFYNGLIDYIKLHFVKSDYIFSIIPFLFKPLLTRKYFFNLHGNFKIERKNKGLGVKLLYLSEFNLIFSDKIILTSYYLSDKLNFKEKYFDKIVLIPNFVKDISKKNKLLIKNDFNFMTITSFKFYKKGKGIINLGKVIKKIAEDNPSKIIKFSIIGNEDNEIFLKIKKEFDNIIFPINVRIIWKGWLTKYEIEKEFLINNTFLYWTELDNYPGVILDAINHNLRVFTNDFESFKYFLDENIICKSEEEMLFRIFRNKNSYFKINYLNDIFLILKKIIN